MGDKSKIEWLDGGASWNPITGCTPISEGCANCYAKTMAETRLRGMFGYDKEDPFKVTFHEDKVEQPFHWKRTRKIFICSMGDLFHEDVLDENIDQIMSIVLADHVYNNTGKHTFILLTKRAERMRRYFRQRDPIEMLKAWANICPIYPNDEDITFRDLVESSVCMDWDKAGRNSSGSEYRPWGYINKLWPLPNLWLGVTAENQRTADERIPILLDTPAAKRFVSVEPMLEQIDLNLFGNRRCGYVNKVQHTPGLVPSLVPVSFIDWVICGAETGQNSRPMDLKWARDLRNQCSEANIPFFFKKAGPNGTLIPVDLMIREYPKE